MGHLTNRSVAWLLNALKVCLPINRYIILSRLRGWGEGEAKGWGTKKSKNFKIQIKILLNLKYILIKLNYILLIFNLF